MKISRALTLLTAILLTACGGHKSSFNSVSDQSQSSEPELATEAYDGYYRELGNWQNGNDLKDKLQKLMIKNGYKPLSYVKSSGPNYESNIKADRSYEDHEYLDVVYSATDIYKTDTSKGWQREHAFCASLMCGSLTADAVKTPGRATDFHNLFASQAGANSSRGNKNYGNADKTKESYQNRTTNDGKDGYSFDNKNFEPADKDKGRLARAIFYMATMYKDDVEDPNTHIMMKGLKIVEDYIDFPSNGVGYEAFAIGNLSTLLDWNKKYPVDFFEMQHNESVYRDVISIDGYAQGNRNPYVDFPELVDYVFGDKMTTPFVLDTLIPSERLLQSSSLEFSHYAIKEAKRSYIPGESIKADDYKIVKVSKNYNEETVSEGITHSLTNHVFSESDGLSVLASIGVGQQIINYQITVNTSGSTSTGEIVPKADDIPKKNEPNVDHEVTFGDIPFIINYNPTTYIQNISTGGITFGSGNNSLDRLSITTKESYTINAAYIKAFVGNKNSSYSLTIKIGDTIIGSASVNNSDSKQFGTSIATPLTGQLSYIFTGSSSLKINSIAFNAINA